MASAADYGDHNAAIYDHVYPTIEPGVLDTLEHLADGESAFELGVGTGRVALPLAARGIEVQGIEASPAMIRLLRQRPGGADFRVHRGDFATTPLGGPWRLVFSLVDTLRLLASFGRVQACFGNVMAHLRPDGAFLVEGHEPDVGGDSPVRIEVPLHIDGTRQVYRLSLLPVSQARLDAAAAHAGMAVASRWQDWQGTPCPDRIRAGQRVITVYRPA